MSVVFSLTAIRLHGKLIENNYSKKLFLKYILLQEIHLHIYVLKYPAIRHRLVYFKSAKLELKLS